MSEGQYYILLFASLAVTLIAQILVKSRYNKYKQVNSNTGLNGENIARRILDENGMQDVKVIPIEGTLTDNYNPSSKTVSLSKENFYGTSIAGIAVAAHECGHAIQHHTNYPFIRLRSGLVPILNITSKLSYVIILLGYALGALQLFEIGIILEAVAVLFQLVTLPVEFNASRRGMEQLKKFGFSSSELSDSRKMLTAAALTYVGAALSAVVSLLRLILMLNNSRRRD